MPTSYERRCCPCVWSPCERRLKDNVDVGGEGPVNIEDLLDCTAFSPCHVCHTFVSKNLGMIIWEIERISMLHTAFVYYVFSCPG